MLYPMWQQTLARLGNAVALRDAAAGVLLTFADLQRTVEGLPALRRGELHGVPVKDGVASFVAQSLRAWRDGAVLCPLEREGANLPGVPGLPHGIAHLKVTSGSTGEPKYVAFRPEQLVADADNIRSTMGLDTEYPNVAVVSVAHSYGFSNLVLPLLLQGHPMFVVADALPASLRAAFAVGERLTLPAVPAMWRAWWQAGLLEEAPVALAISAGAPLPLELEQAVFAKCGLKIHNFYGSSECGGIAYDRSLMPREDAAFAGTAMEGVKLSVNGNGCLVVSGGNVGECYWPDSEATLGNGRFVTSDLVTMSKGRVFMEGRMSDAINVAGRKLNPSDVEHAVLTCEGVKHCVVFGVPSADVSRCEETVACVNAGPAVTEKQVLRAAGTRLASWQMPRRVWFRDDLEPNARGKLSRAEWRTRWLSLKRELRVEG